MDVAATSPQADWHAFRAWPVQAGWIGLATAVQVLALVGSVIAWDAGWWPITLACYAYIVWMHHAALTQMHEAGHGTLWKNRLVNEAHGVLIGTLALIPMSVYRYVHARHHAHLGNERDPEFWPYNLTESPRRVRVLYAWSEIFIGWLLTPLLYSVRTARSWRLVPRRQRPRIVAEWAVIAVFWSAVLLVVIRRGWVEPFLIAVVIPAWLAGSVQTLRKFTEHLGMHGDTILTMTRTVGYRGAAGRAASRTQRHVDHHGTHHRHARIPFYELPRATEEIYGEEGARRLFRSHWEAVLDMLPHLLDPKVGPQWRCARDADESLQRAAATSEPR